MQDAIRSTLGLFQSADVPVSKESKGPPAYAYIKYIVVPSKAKAFIKVNRLHSPELQAQLRMQGTSLKCSVAGHRGGKRGC